MEDRDGAPVCESVRVAEGLEETETDGDSVPERLAEPDGDTVESDRDRDKDWWLCVVDWLPKAVREGLVEAVWLRVGDQRIDDVRLRDAVQVAVAVHEEVVDATALSVGEVLPVPERVDERDVE